MEKGVEYDKDDKGIMSSMGKGDKGKDDKDKDEPEEEDEKEEVTKDVNMLYCHCCYVHFLW